MSFTPEDNMCEILLKVMLSDAERETGAGGDQLVPEDRAVIEDWLQSLRMEGPECRRIASLMNQPIDRIQAGMYRSELKAALISRENRERVQRILDRILGRRNTVYSLEAKLYQEVQNLMEDRSGIERLVQKANVPTASVMESAPGES